MVSEVFHPEDSATGHVMTAIAEGLAETYPVTAICAQPSYSNRGRVAPRKERYNGIDIIRVRSTTFNPHSAFLLKLLNVLSVGLSSFWAAMRNLGPNDHVFTVTNPPVAPYLILLAARLRGAHCSVIVHDLYPEALAPAGMIRATSLSYRVMAWFARQLFRRADDVIVVGRDQAQLVRSKLQAGDAPKVRVIRQSADLESITNRSKSGNAHLRALNLDDPNMVIVQFAGNIGPLQNIDRLIEMISKSAHIPKVHFLFFGSGRSREKLEREVADRGLTNVTVADPVPRSEADEMHAASDVALISLTPGMLGVSVPSRIGNALASGRPIMGVVEQGSELQQLIAETGCGWWIDPTDVAAFVKTIDTIALDPEMVVTRQELASNVAERLFGLDTMIEEYLEVVRDNDPALVS